MFMSELQVQFQFLSEDCVSSGLLAGLWEFPSLLLKEENSEVKQKKALRDEISTVLRTSMTDHLQYVGEVRLMSSGLIHVS